MKRENLIVKLSDIKLNEDNPRTIKDKQMKRLVKSIQDFPEMMQLRPIVIDENNVILGGNMRFRAMQKLGEKTTEVIKVTGLTEDQKREFIIKDNVPFGEWDWDELANSWDADELSKCGLDTPKDETEHYADLLDVELPTYEPSSEPVDVAECADCSTSEALEQKIEQAKCPDQLKKLLRHRASFFVKFNWQRIADLYAIQDEQTKELMRELGMVIIIPKEAYARGIAEFRKDFDEWLST